MSTLEYQHLHLTLSILIYSSQHHIKGVRVKNVHTLDLSWCSFFLSLFFNLIFSSRTFTTSDSLRFSPAK